MITCRMTDEDGAILNGCTKKCRRFDTCVGKKDEICEYEPGMAPHYSFHLGKHKGDTVAEVINADPQYLLWMTANVKWFTMSATARGDFLASHPDMEKELYAAEVARESKFTSNKTTENDKNVQDYFVWDANGGDD